ncbi:MAG TPA: alpha/beta hydrolase [Polyangiales bacterium]|nr:alpha/beta hydrolase [Polyangiales bacterium]
MQQVTSKDGTSIAFDRAGQGPSLILVDGALCRRQFGPMPALAQKLSDRFSVITYDRRGRGDSGDTAPYSVEREVEDLRAVIEAAGGSAYVFGASSGGALALEAVASGLPITALAMFEPPFVAAEASSSEADHLAHLKQLLAAGKRGAAVRYFLKDMVRAPGPMVAIMQLMFPIWSKLKAVAHTLPYDCTILGNWAIPMQRAAQVKIPTLVAAGSKTDPRLRRAAKLLADAIPRAEHAELAGQNHNASADAVAPVLAKFFLRLGLERHDVARPADRLG